MGSFSVWHWLVVLAIVLVIFGTKKLRNAGGDLGEGIKNFKKAMKEGEESAPKTLDAVARDAERSSETTTTKSGEKHNA
jgi:sec-independent protein translocase protein TatA